MDAIFHPPSITGHRPENRSKKWSLLGRVVKADSEEVVYLRSVARIGHRKTAEFRHFKSGLRFCVDPAETGQVQHRSQKRAAGKNRIVSVVRTRICWWIAEFHTGTNVCRLVIIESRVYMNLETAVRQ